MNALPSNSPDAALARWAAGHHQVVARPALLRLGFTDTMIRTRERRSQLHQQHRGVWSIGVAELTPEGRALAAVLAVGPDALVSHATAAGLWGMRDRTGWSDVDVVTARDVRDLERVRVHRSRTLTAADRTTVRGVPLTTPERTMLDTAGGLAVGPLETIVDRALAKDLLREAPMQDVLRRATGRYGVGRLREALGLTLTRSELERMFLRYVESLALPVPLTNQRVAGREVDALWPAHGLIVELDGWRFHRTRGAFESDHDRDLDLGLLGYRVLRLTYRQLTRRPEAVAARLRLELRPGLLDASASR